MQSLSSLFLNEFNCQTHFEAADSLVCLCSNSSPYNPFHTDVQVPCIIFTPSLTTGLAITCVLLIQYSAHRHNSALLLISPSSNHSLRGSTFSRLFTSSVATRRGTCDCQPAPTYHESLGELVAYFRLPLGLDVRYACEKRWELFQDLPTSGRTKPEKWGHGARQNVPQIWHCTSAGLK